MTKTVIKYETMIRATTAIITHRNNSVLLIAHFQHARSRENRENITP